MPWRRMIKQRLAIGDSRLGEGGRGSPPSEADSSRHVTFLDSVIVSMDFDIVKSDAHVVSMDSESDRLLRVFAAFGRVKMSMDLDVVCPRTIFRFMARDLGTKRSEIVSIDSVRG